MVTVGTLSNILHFVFLFFLSLDESYESNIVFPRLSLSLSISLLPLNGKRVCSMQWDIAKNKYIAKTKYNIDTFTQTHVRVLAC